MFGSKFKGTDPTLSTQFYLDSRPRLLGSHGWSYTVSANVGYDYNSIVASRSVLSQGITTRLYAPAVRLGRSTSIHTNLEAKLYHDTSSLWNAGIGGTVTLRQGLGRSSSASLAYTYDPGLISFANSSASQYITASVYASKAGRWFVTLYGTENLSSDSLFAFGSLSYRFSPLWSLWVDTSYQDFSGAAFTDYEVALGRTIGTLEARLAYSKSRGKVFFEFGTTRF